MLRAVIRIENRKKTPGGAGTANPRFTLWSDEGATLHAPISALWGDARRGQWCDASKKWTAHPPPPLTISRALTFVARCHPSRARTGGRSEPQGLPARGREPLGHDPRHRPASCQLQAAQKGRERGCAQQHQQHTAQHAVAACARGSRPHGPLLPAHASLTRGSSRSPFSFAAQRQRRSTVVSPR